ncbi:type IX secretion system outer membrane channel protein PorV [Ichthyenterobacterium sp. W332]|uniref:Type IX secretion system outer membrane channel protein PorV n=1 Tax=Microcosmobacter mediterraneus TaxID=3075607 RepID=A0ABU2YME3_9FLAO|nr:type IX secretion system outer membrane channel protein PorV [Ichthyenterobacterium sp. W332]MDT0558445.1 type IX secretion system outer membrane channel protein PorV [Ichthyenterobacterium sp. W332]
MKKYVLTLITLIYLNLSFGQETVVFPDQSSVITTGVPFMLIAPDARAAGMGDMGVATSVDGYAQQWNAAKYAFSEAKSGISLSYTPYLSRLVNDISVGYLTYFNRLTENSAISGSFKYFSLGEITLTQGPTDPGVNVKPNEFTADIAYTLRLADQFAMGVTLRYLRSDLRINQVDPNANAANTFGVDISGYYQSEEEAYNDFNGRWRAGFAIQNVGPKFKYDDGGRENFQPTNLRLGGGFDFIFDNYNKLGITAEVTKLLVPTPPLLGFEDIIQDGDTEPNGVQDSNEPTIIVEGQDNNVSFINGIFQSFGDAPGGFSEEIQEFTWALGAEYQYQESFAFRAGYFNEAEEKGARKFFALGAGFKYSTINIDLSYLFSASKVQSPLENTLRFSLTFNFGDEEYEEY